MNLYVSQAHGQDYNRLDNCLTSGYLFDTGERRHLTRLTVVLRTSD